MYACGITVSGEAHIGHGYQALIYDIMRKFLVKLGYEVTYARNYTDVDDKIIAKSNETGIPADEYAEKMIEKIRKLIEKYWDILSYLFFGVLTTVVNYLIYLPVYNLLGLSAAVSNAIAWVVAVAFAYLTNKPFVFKSHDWSAKVVLPELGKFVSCRIGSGVLETAIIFLTVDLMNWDGTWMKLATNVMVVILNYFGSKLLVFRNKK